MNVVNPEARTTLLLNANFLAINIVTARAAFRHIITGGAEAIDRFHMPHGFQKDEKGKDIIDYNSHYWFYMKESILGRMEGDVHIPYQECDGIYYANQPVLRSANDTWPIPTIALTTSRFFKGRSTGNVSIQKLAKIYKNVCQICGEKFPTSQLTIEHVYPKSKHGPKQDFNCLPTCVKCNRQKADTTPYFDYQNVNLEEKIRPLPSFVMSNETEHRPEWEAYAVFKYPTAELIA